jgi:hypothetical protein
VCRSEICGKAWFADLEVKGGRQFGSVNGDAKAATVEALGPAIGPVSNFWFDVSLLC